MPHPGAMAVELLPYALLTLEQGMALLDIGDSLATEELVTDLINETTAYCEWWTNRPLRRRELARVFPARNVRTVYEADKKLLLAASPIDTTQPITVKMAGQSLTVWKTPTDGAVSGFDVRVGYNEAGTPSHLYRAAGWNVPSGDPIVVTYTGGLEPVPGDLTIAAKHVLDNLYRAQKRKLTSDVVNYGGPVAPSIGFRGELIPMQAKQILDSYKFWDYDQT